MCQGLGETVCQWTMLFGGRAKFVLCCPEIQISIWTHFWVGGAVKHMNGVFQVRTQVGS